MVQQIYKTEQENFWAGEFGDSYTERNQGKQLVAANSALFARILARTTDVHSLIEFGANVGLNLIAIRWLLPQVQLAAVEINQKAVEQLRQQEGIEVYSQSILDFAPDKTRDFVLIKGVLIHLHPDKLDAVYDLLYRASHRYICLVEYYNPTPMEVPYRGHQGRLFKRDYAGEMLDKYPDLQLLDYGFIYRRDNQFRQDDLTWFLLEKR